MTVTLCFSGGRESPFISSTTTLLFIGCYPWLLPLRPKLPGMWGPPHPLVYVCSPHPPASSGRDAKNFVFFRKKNPTKGHTCERDSNGVVARR